MRLAFAVADPADESFEELRDELARDPRLRGAQVKARAARPEDGTLGVAEVLEFLGSDVLLPVAIQVVYDWYKERRKRVRAPELTVVVTMVDHPDGAREVKIEAGGSADDVIKALRAGR